MAQATAVLLSKVQTVQKSNTRNVFLSSYISLQDGKTALILAIENECDNIVKYLLGEKGAINMEDLVSGILSVSMSNAYGTLL